MNTPSLEPSRRSLLVRQGCFVLLALATVAFISWHTGVMLRVNGWDPLKVVTFGLFVTLLVPIALSFWTAVIGFLVQWHGGDAFDLSRALASADAAGLQLPRTAVVMPIYNEDPARVFAGLKATYQSLEQTKLLQHFDFFLLSDTTDPDLWVREELAFDALRKQVSDPGRLMYRNRRQNTEKKTGNIADFCATWGDAYEYMIVFDADSIMTGASLVNLVRLMEQHPRVGIIQAPPLPVNRRTLFGRLHQFATHAYSLIFISGLNFWQGGAGNYWGHNAIIRLGPFVEHCRLPILPGKPPLGGSILSHDFVEAAFMRRAGWKVYLASGIRGSYEELPSSLIGYAARDRRWCQGNLQHSKLLCTPGLHVVSRIHIWMGLMAYLASPFWLMLLALTTVQGLLEHLGPHHYFDGKSLFPTWRISVEQQALLLFAGMLLLLLLPKLLTVVLYLRDRSRGAGFGSRRKLLLSVFLEMLVSTLLAPNLALLQARFVAGILLGSNVKWEAQDRGEEGTSYREAFRRHWPSTLIGLAWPALLLTTAPKLFWWFSPVIVGFLLAIPLSVWSSRTNLGEWARQKGVFVISEELAPPEILVRLQQELEAAAAHPWAREGDGLARVLENPQVRAVHLALLSVPDKPKDELQQHYLEGLRL
ncbi:MAG TPA: glucans biosynthesis glucosyltransferase MdoH, partial [Candidatus Sulfotelmatobacter sp.]|nr:glucans biosynthesis glucosyltransferase MdoH [Candidatus Sulfotelmatobacter sp.]